MAGWTFGTAPNYARSASPVTAYPFSVLVHGANIDLADASNDYLFHMGQSGSAGNHWAIRRDGSETVLRFTSTQGGTGSAAISTTTISSGVPFTCVAIATSATDRKIIVNGDTGGAGVNTTSSTPASVDRMSFGQKDDTTQGNSWEGSIFGGALWTAALSDAEAVALCAGVWPMGVRPAALRNFWPNFVDRGDGLIQDWRGVSPLTLSGGSLTTQSVRRMGPPAHRIGRHKRTLVIAA